MSVLETEPFLKISSSPVLIQQFLHECVDDLLGKTKANFNNYNSDIEWTVDDYNKARTSIQNIYRHCVIANKFELNVDEDNSSESLYKAIQDCYEIRKSEIFQMLVEESIVNNGHNLVKNIDWRLKWVMGSSKLATIREPLLQVDLQYITADKNKIKSRDYVNFEVNLAQLDDLIRELTTIKTELEN